MTNCLRTLKHLALAGAVATLLFSGTVAKAVLVTSDAGSIASFKLTNLGAGSFQLDLTGPGALTAINGVAPAPAIAAAFTTPVLFTASVAGTTVTVTGGGAGTKTFTDPAGGTATLSYALTGGDIGTGINKNGLILAGLISGIGSNAVAGYDFSPLVGGTHTWSLAGAIYSGIGVTSMASVFATTGATVTGSASFSELQAVPEPATVALMGIGLAGLVTMRRFRKRSV